MRSRVLRLPTAAVVAGVTGLMGLGLGLGIPVAASSLGPPSHASTDASFPHMDHVFVIMMENTSYATEMSSSNANTAFVRTLAKTYGLETDYYGVTHTSLPNYVAATSGSTWGSNTDDEAQATDGDFNHLSLFDELDQAHLTWKSYQESIPSVGYTGDFGDCTTSTGAADPDCTQGDTSSALYVRKHNPAMQYPDIFGNAQLRDNVVPLTQLSTDLQDNQVPDFSWITPNICDDMHGGAPQCPYPTTTPPTTAHQAALYRDGNDFLETWVTKIMDSRAWTGNSAIFVTWDEGGYENVTPYGPETDSGCCDSPILPKTPVTPTEASGGDLAGGTLYGGGHIPMIVISREGARGATDADAGNHYSLLQTIESNWGLPFIGDASDTLQVHSLAPLLTSSGRAAPR